MDEDMRELVESVRERGIIVPVILRKKEDGRYETVSGHRRVKACGLAGLKTVRAEVREMTRDEAIILMIDSNLHRSSILPSEKAFSYRMKLEAMNRQGLRTDLTFSPMDKKLRSGIDLANQLGESQAQIYRYIRLTELIPEILETVDDGRMALRPAVEISYLTENEQRMLAEAMDYFQCTPSHAQAIRLRTFSKEGVLGKHLIERIMEEEKPNQRQKISLAYGEARRFIPSSVPYEKTGDYILKALEFYGRHRQRSDREAR